MKRRELLAGAVGFAFLSGCLNRKHETRLGRISIGNFTPTPKKIKIIVRYNDSIIHDKIYRIEGDDDDDRVTPSASIGDELPKEPGTYMIKYGFPHESLETIDVSEHIKTECGQVLLDIRKGPRVNILYSGGCDTLNE